jgi:CRISPR type I-D-associated protein Csc2
MKEIKLLDNPTILSQGIYLQLAVKLKLLDDAIIRSNEPEEVLTFNYKPPVNTRFIVPWRKVKGKLRRLVSEKQRGLGIEVDCHLKDDLCMQCPNCFLFGGTGETSNKGAKYNILSRVLGETFISTSEVGEIQPYTENAVDEIRIDTRRAGENTGALMSIVTVPKETEFLGIVTLRDSSPEMASILVENLNRLTRLGASTREWGRIKTEILGYILSDREELSAYDHIPPKDQLNGLNNIADLKLPDVDESYKNLDLDVKNLLKKNKLIT